jgi:hypothetical protein
MVTIRRNKLLVALTRKHNATALPQMLYDIPYSRVGRVFEMKLSSVVRRGRRLELIETFPGFFSPGERRSQGTACLPECGEGWRPILDRCCERIAATLQDGERFRFEKIVERQGSLRIYWGGRLSAASEAAVREAIDLAEARSQCVCEHCGEPGRQYRQDGAVITRCDAHARGMPLPVRRGYENVHLTQKVIKGRARVVVACRYNPKTDSFAEVDPTALGIKED